MAHLPCPWDSPGENTGVGCHALFCGDLPDPGIEPASPVSSALQVHSLLLSHQGSPYSIYSCYQILAIFPTLHNISSEFLLYVTVCTSYSSTPILTLLPSLSLLLITTDLFSLSVSLHLFCYIHYFVTFFRFHM